MKQLYTKAQLQKVYEGWGVEADVPKKGGRVAIAFPPPVVLDLAVITRHPGKGTYGDVLYQVEMTSAAQRTGK